MIYIYRYRKQNRQQGEIDIFTYVQWKDEDVEPEGYQETIFVEKTKPLSEKELYEVFDKCYPNNGDGDVVTLVDFARAIEERHGIK